MESCSAIPRLQSVKRKSQKQVQAVKRLVTSGIRDSKITYAFFIFSSFFSKLLLHSFQLEVITNTLDAVHESVTVHGNGIVVVFSVLSSTVIDVAVEEVSVERSLPRGRLQFSFFS